VWGSLHIQGPKHRIPRAVPCARGRAPVGTMVGRHRGAGGRIVALRLQTAPGPHSRVGRCPMRTPSPDREAGPEVPYLRRNYRLDQRSRLAAPFPKGGRSTPRTGSPRAARGVGSCRGGRGAFGDCPNAMKIHVTLTGLPHSARRECCHYRASRPQGRRAEHDDPFSCARRCRTIRATAEAFAMRRPRKERL
jgi:hypothetical protein